MAGTDPSQKTLLTDAPLAPVIILVEPQMGENIGMCARAMLNCGVTELRIVNPRDGWPNPSATASASGAIDVLENAKIYNSTKEAVADLEFVLATTARGRELVKDILSTDQAAQEIHQRNIGGEQKCGVLFGRERTGLENDDIALSNAILNIPLNPGFSSLNLSQAVLLVCFSWLSNKNPFIKVETEEEVEKMLAPKQDIEYLLTHLEEAITKGGFFRSIEQKPNTLRNIRNFFFRAEPTRQEVQTLRGIVSCLAGKNKPEK